MFQRHYRDHLRIHSGSRPHVCSVISCGKAFTQSSTLRKHTKTHERKLNTASLATPSEKCDEIDNKSQAGLVGREPEATATTESMSLHNSVHVSDGRTNFTDRETNEGQLQPLCLVQLRQPVDHNHNTPLQRDIDTGMKGYRFQEPCSCFSHITHGPSSSIDAEIVQRSSSGNQVWNYQELHCPGPGTLDLRVTGNSSQKNT